MAVRPYSDMDNTAYGREEAAPTTSGGVGAKIFLWTAWALAAAFWAFSLTTGVGILRAMGGASASGDVGVSGGGWAVMNIVAPVILGMAIAYGAYRYLTRDRSKDALTEAATRAEYDMIEAAGGDEAIDRSPDARDPMDRDAARAVRGDRFDPSTGAMRP
jgi:hypothetical protein